MCQYYACFCAFIPHVYMHSFDDSVVLRRSAAGARSQFPFAIIFVSAIVNEHTSYNRKITVKSFRARARRCIMKLFAFTTAAPRRTSHVRLGFSVYIYKENGTARNK